MSAGGIRVQEVYSGIIYSANISQQIHIGTLTHSHKHTHAHTHVKHTQIQDTQQEQEQNRNSHITLVTFRLYTWRQITLFPVYEDIIQRV
jgi:hypothetical protein